MSAKARVRLEAVGAAKVRQALTGIDRQVEQSNRRRTTAVQRMARTESDASEAVTEQHVRSGRTVEQVNERGHRRQVRRIREESREAQMSARQKERAARNAQRTAARRVLAASAAGAALGAGRAAFSAVSSARATFGLRSGHDELARDQMELARGATHLDAQRQLETGTSASRIHRIATATGVQQDEVLAADAGLQERYATQVQAGSFDEETMIEMAQAARALNVPMSQVTDLMGLFGDTLSGVEGEALIEAFQLLISKGEKGKVGAGTLSTHLASNVGEFARATGITDPTELAGGIADLATLLQQGGQGASETSTMMSSLLRSVGNQDVIDRYNSALGIRGHASPFHEGGDVNGQIDMESFFEVFQDPNLNRSMLGTIFTNETALGAAGILTDATQNEQLMSDLAGATPEDGARFVEDLNTRADAQTFGAMEKTRAQNLASFDPDNGYTGFLAEFSAELSELEATMPEVVGGLKMLGGAISTMGSVLIGGKLAGLFGGGAMAAGGAAAGGGGALGLSAIAPVAAAGVAGAGLGFGVDALAEYLTGESLSSRIGRASHEEDELRATGSVTEYATERGLGTGGLRADGTPAVFRLHPDSAAAVGNATAGALSSQSRRQEGGARGRGGT